MKNLLFIFLTLFIIGPEKQDLSMKLEKGQTYYHNQESRIEMFQKVEGENVDIEMKLDGLTSYFVKDVYPEYYDIECRMKTMYFKMKSPFGKMEFNSENANTEDVFSQIMMEMVDKPYEIKLRKDGSIKEFSGMEKIIENIMKNFSYLPDESLVKIRKILEDNYGKDAVKGNFEMVTAILPEDKVAKGESWSKTHQTAVNLNATMTNNYVLKKVKRKYYLIEGNGLIKTSSEKVDLGNVYATYYLTGSSVHHIKLNRKNCWIKNAEIKQNIQGYYIMEIPGQKETFKIPLEARIQTKIIGEKD